MADATEPVDVGAAGEGGSSSEEDSNELPPPPPTAANLNEHLVGMGWMMKKSRQLKGRFQKRFFRVDGESLKHYANTGVSKTVRAVLVADVRRRRSRSLPSHSVARFLRPLTSTSASCPHPLSRRRR